MAAFKPVSITNGMEFYFENAKLEQIAERSFNSQRDGILHERYVKEMLA